MDVKNEGGSNFSDRMKGPIVVLPNDKRRASAFASSEGLVTFHTYHPWEGKHDVNMPLSYRRSLLLAYAVPFIFKVTARTKCKCCRASTPSA